MDSIKNGRGDDILLILSRQSGKNETIAQLLTYLLNLLHRAGDNVGRGIRRLEEHLDNCWNAIKRYLDLYGDGVLSKNEYLGKRKERDCKIEARSKKIAERKQQLQEKAPLTADHEQALRKS
jgi:hypothetical protein